MVKSIIFAGLMLAGAQVLAAPNVWSQYSCSQRCGLTENTYTSVSFQSTDLWATKTALRDFCEAQKFHLQGEPRCSQANYDFTKDESYQRCLAGLPGNKTCNVTVIGYNTGDTDAKYFYERGRSFAEAESSAMSSCRSGLNSYNSHCIVGSYYLQ